MKLYYQSIWQNFSLWHHRYYLAVGLGERSEPMMILLLKASHLVCSIDPAPLHIYFYPWRLGMNSEREYFTSETDSFSQNVGANARFMVHFHTCIDFPRRYFIVLFLPKRANTQQQRDCMIHFLVILRISSKPGKSKYSISPDGGAQKDMP